MTDLSELIHDVEAATTEHAALRARIAALEAACAAKDGALKPLAIAPVRSESEMVILVGRDVVAARLARGMPGDLHFLYCDCVSTKGKPGDFRIVCTKCGSSPVAIEAKA